MPFDLKNPIVRKDITKAAIVGIRLTSPGTFLLWRESLDVDGKAVDGTLTTADCTLADNPAEFAACSTALAAIEASAKELTDPAVVAVVDALAVEPEKP